MQGSRQALHLNLHQFRQEVEKIFSCLQGDEILLLSGEMGAGKTEFVKTLARLIGVRDVVSPTFALHQTFQHGAYTLDHFDLYRLESLDELESVGIWDLLSVPSLVLIEWPERVPINYWPQNRKILKIEIERAGNDHRNLKWSWLKPL